jgi:predicted transcriptional regulator
MKDESKAELLLLSKEQVAAIRKGEEQIANGQYLTDAEVRKRTAQWLGFLNHIGR